MSVPIAVFLGLLQGLTEFLPVSSSGHLAIAAHFLPEFEEPGVLFEIVVHLGTLFAVMLYLRREVGLLVSGLRPGADGSIGRKLILMLVIATIPAVIAGFTGRSVIEESFDNIALVGLCLCVTGVLLLYSSRLVSKEPASGLGDIGPVDALVVGLFQIVALFPGISRSGTTIVAGLGRGLAHDTAARFSFLMSLPAIAGAAVLMIPEASRVPSSAAVGYLAGFLTAFAIGYLSIGIVIKFLASRRFHLFGYYCLATGGAILGSVALGII